MKKLIFIIIFIHFLFFGCNEQNDNDKPNTEMNPNIGFFQSDESSFRMLKKDTINGKVHNPFYVINSTNYKVFRILDTINSKYNMTYHIAKINKVSKMVNGAEGGTTKISAEIRGFDNPHMIEFKISETESDEIIFEPHLYRIIENGCCSFNGWIKLYNYKHELIDEGEPDEIYKKYPEW